MTERPFAKETPGGGVEIRDGWLTITGPDGKPLASIRPDRALWHEIALRAKAALSSL